MQSLGNKITIITKNKNLATFWLLTRRKVEHSMLHKNVLDYSALEKFYQKLRFNKNETTEICNRRTDEK